MGFFDLVDWEVSVDLYFKQVFFVRICHMKLHFLTVHKPSSHISCINFIDTNTVNEMQFNTPIPTLGNRRHPIEHLNTYVAKCLMPTLFSYASLGTDFEIWKWKKRFGIIMIRPDIIRHMSTRIHILRKISVSRIRLDTWLNRWEQSLVNQCLVTQRCGSTPWTRRGEKTISHVGLFCVAYSIIATKILRWSL